MNDINYLLDENVDHALYIGLLRHASELTVWRVGMLGAPAKGTLDPDILLWCEANSFILVTNNRKSMPVHLRQHLAEERHMPGILILTEKMSIGETIEELLLIWTASSQLEYQDRIIHLPIG